MEAAQKEDRILFTIVFALAAFLVMAVYDLLYYLSTQQPAPFPISPLGWTLISWGLRLAALTALGVLVMRTAALQKKPLFLVIMGVALAYALASAILSNALYAGTMKQAFLDAAARYRAQLSAGGSSLSLDRLFPIVLLANVVFRLVGLAIAAVISYFAASGIEGLLPHPAPDRAAPGQGAAPTDGQPPA
jgi:hypothetical protein